MPLQIRRGTAAERNAISSPLAIGELLYVTDQGKIYIGDGTALGDPDIAGNVGQGGKGLIITGFTSEEAQDATASAFANGSHTGISFTYDDGANAISAEVDLSSYVGNVSITGALTVSGELNAAAFRGSIFADNSTLLVDAVSGSIPYAVLSGAPTEISSFTNDVGYIRSSDITDGTLSIDVNNTGDLQGNVFGDDSTLLVDAINSLIPASVVSGTFTGDVVGNITTNRIASSDSSTVVIESPAQFLTTVLVDSNLNVNDNVLINGNLSVIGDLLVASNGVFSESIQTNNITNDNDIIIRSETGATRFINPTGGTIFGSPIENGTGNIFINRTGYSGNINAGLAISTHHGFTPEMDGINFIRSAGDSVSPLSIRQFDILGVIDYAAYDGTTTKLSLRHYVTSEIVDSTTVASNFVLESLDVNGDMTQRFRILQDGRVCLGPLLVTDNDSGKVALEIYNTQYVTGKNEPGKPIHIRQYYDGQPANGMNTLRSRGTRAVPATILGGDQLFEITAMAFDGSVARLSSRINFLSDTTLLPNAIPGIISFDVTGSTGTFLRAVQIRPDGRLYADYGIKGDVVGSIFADDSTMIIDATEGGKITAPSATLSDFLQLPVMSNDSQRLATIPTPSAGMVIFMQLGTTPAATNQIQVFDGSNWVNV